MSGNQKENCSCSMTCVLFACFVSFMKKFKAVEQIYLSSPVIGVTTSEVLTFLVHINSAQQTEETGGCQKS